MKKPADFSVWERIHHLLEDIDRSASLQGEAGERILRERWKKRAEELARPAAGGEESLLWEKIIVLKVGRERYAFKVDDVEEVMRVPPVTPVPCVPPHFIGVVNRRGNILPLVDLKVFFGGERCPESEASRVVVLSRNRMCLGLLVEAADKIIGLPPDSVKPPLKRGEGVQEEFCLGVVTMGKKLVVLIDSARLLTDKRMMVDKGV